MRIRHDNGAFEWRAVRLEAFDLDTERPLGESLRGRIERRIDLEACRLEVARRVVAIDLRPDQIQERRIVSGLPALPVDDAERSTFRGRLDLG